MLEDLSYIDCKDFLESVGINNITESNGEISFSCPSSDHFHGDNNPSARMNSRTSAWMCHGCYRKGNAVSFLSWHKSIPITVARRLLEERYSAEEGAGVINLEEEVMRIMNKEETVEDLVRISPDKTWLNIFYHGIHNNVQAQKYMTKRGFGQQICEEWQIGYDEYSDRITIPVFDYDDKLVGFKGRAWKENPIGPKYMILGDNGKQNHYGFQPYQKSKYVFGINRCFHYPHRILYDFIIVEGELNVIALSQYGFNGAIGIAGSEFSDSQCELIKSIANSSTLYLDNDKAGDKGTKKVIEMLSPYMPLRIVQNAPGDAADLDKRTVNELISSAEPALLLQAQGRV